MQRTPQADFGLCLALLGSLLSFVFALVVPHFLNMFWQIPDGAEILRGHFPTTIPYAIESGPLVSQEWLFEAALAWAAQHSVYGAFVIACGLAAAATPILGYAAIRSFGIGDMAAGVAALLIAGSRFQASAIRPETWAVDCFAIEILLLARARRPYLVLPCVVVWANVHASVLLAPIAAVCFALGAFNERRCWDARVKQSVAVAVAVLLATLVTPHGFRLWHYVFALAVAPNPTREHLETWNALSFGTVAGVLSVLPGMLILLWLGIERRRAYAVELLLAAVVFALTIMHQRYAVFLAVAWAPAIARSLEHRAHLVSIADARPRAPLLYLAPAAWLAVVAAFGRISVPIEPAGPWQAAAGIVSDNNLRGNAYAPYVWAAFLHWRGLPLRLLIDAHGDPYPVDVWNDHLALEKASPNWREVVARRRLAVIVLGVDSPLAQLLTHEASWRRVETRAGVVGFAKRDDLARR